MKIWRGGTSKQTIGISTIAVFVISLAVWRIPAQATLPPGVMPVAGAVEAEFAAPTPNWLPGHRGLDLAASVGQDVKAPQGGRIGFVGEVAGTPVVTLWHGAIRSTYQPVSSARLPGETVITGEVIGRIAADGGHCAGQCVHWGLRSGEYYLDPRLLLGGGRVRLISVQD